MTWFHKSSEENFHIPFQRGALSPSCMVNFIMQKVMESMCNVTVRSDDYPRDIAYKNCHNNILLVCHYKLIKYMFPHKKILGRIDI